VYYHHLPSFILKQAWRWGIGNVDDSENVCNYCTKLSWCKMKLIIHSVFGQCRSGLVPCEGKGLTLILRNSILQVTTPRSVKCGTKPILCCTSPHPPQAQIGQQFLHSSRSTSCSSPSSGPEARRMAAKRQRAHNRCLFPCSHRRSSLLYSILPPTPLFQSTNRPSLFPISFSDCQLLALSNSQSLLSSSGRDVVGQITPVVGCHPRPEPDWDRSGSSFRPT
jgi:hypothetical protein